MNTRNASILITVSLALLAANPPAGARPAAQTPAALARLATAGDPKVSHPAVAALRAMGPPGLQALFDMYAPAINKTTRTEDARWPRLCAALDEVGQQRDDYASRLYWYTDLEKAKAAARKSGKPILSLRLLGKLNEELSCANSRFFRTALYPNAEVGQFLRDHFILHWKSERPAPKITIDFGDGRKIERTITGNSIHYVLDAEGRPIDALPGLYGPAAFLRELRRDVDWSAQLAAVPSTQRPALLKSLHAARYARQFTEWDTDSKTLVTQGINAPSLGALLLAVSLQSPAQPAQGFGFPTARVAAPIAMSKMAVEMPTVTAISSLNPTARDVIPQEVLWAKLGALHAGDARLDANGLALMASKYPGLPSTTSLAESFERSMAQDTVRNEYILHAQIHNWFSQESGTDTLEGLNRQVYSKLFLTPRTDPWLGLAAENAYAALPNGGLIEPSRIAVQQARTAR